MFENRGENEWVNKLLKLTMMQWITDYTRCKIKDINYECPFGSSNHMVLEIEINDDIEDKQEDLEEKKKKRNYAKFKKRCGL